MTAIEEPRLRHLTVPCLPENTEICQVVHDISIVNTTDTKLSKKVHSCYIASYSVYRLFH